MILVQVLTLILLVKTIYTDGKLSKALATVDMHNCMRIPSHCSLFPPLLNHPPDTILPFCPLLLITYLFI